jgi:uncharacterized damage-inducible protein DinB
VTLQDLRTLLDYHYWARDRALDGAEALTPEQFTRDMGSSFRSVRDTLVHTYSAEWIWLSRWQGTSPTQALPLDRFSDVGALRAAWQDQEASVRALVDGYDDERVNRVIEYQLLSGRRSASPFWQMVQHVANHATYHRGQLTTMLRQLGAAPPKPMDLIAFYRERGA